MDRRRLGQTPERLLPPRTLVPLLFSVLRLLRLKRLDRRRGMGREVALEDRVGLFAVTGGRGTEVLENSVMVVIVGSIRNRLCRLALSHPLRMRFMCRVRHDERRLLPG